MDIIDQLNQFSIQYEDKGEDLTFQDMQRNLGVIIKYRLGAYECHFWDANGCCYSPEFLALDLSEILVQFDRLILSYYQEDFNDHLFADWHSMDLG
jgi:hypothetical protein